MNDSEIRVAIARLDGWKESVNPANKKWRHRESDEWFTVHDELPNYLISHDALAPVLAGLSCSEFNEWEIALREICSRAGVRLLLATAAQKCEALLRAKGLWGK